MALKIAAEVYPRVEQDKLEAAKQPQYFANRVEYDRAAQYAFSQALRIAGAQEQAGATAAATLTYRRAYLSYPEYPEATAIAQAIGDRLRRQGQWTGALAYYLEVLDTGEDRCFQPQALLGENQRYLTPVAKPPARPVIHAALVGFNECLKAGKVGKPVSDADLATFEEGWYGALTSTFEPTTASGAEGWVALLAAQAEPTYRDLVRLALAQGLLREGRLKKRCR